jgi:signal transduction histidine kinase
MHLNMPNATLCKYNLTHHKDMCILSIHDNGKGFDVSKVVSGNGIYNMQQRAKKINADFHIESEENKGTTITLKFRITQYR